MMTSDTCLPSIPARFIAPAIAALPSSWAGSGPDAPLNAPTGVRAAPTMTMSSDMKNLLIPAASPPMSASRWGHLIPHRKAVNKPSVHVRFAGHHELAQGPTGLFWQKCRLAQNGSPLHSKVLMLAWVTAQKVLFGFQRHRLPRGTSE